MEQRELVVIGGGPAGMSAAVSAFEAGARDVCIIDREPALGGILKQCIHTGFGLHRYQEELTGPEYAYREQEKVIKYGIPVYHDTTVTDLTGQRVLTAVHQRMGYFQIEAQAVILAMGCRERSRGALNIAGTRPAGIFTAGTAQKYVNLYGKLPGRHAVILGSGDIGLIMARRLTLEGAKVAAVCELMPYPGGLARNIAQCLDDFGIPLLLSHTVVEIHGTNRVSGVTIAKVDEAKKVVPGTERRIDCDTLLLSVGLVCENELSKKAGIALDPATGGAVVDQSRETSIPGIFACGNVLHVHDLADYASEEAEIAGRSAAASIRNQLRPISTEPCITLQKGTLVRYLVPQKITAAQDTTIFFRVQDMCRDVEIRVTCGGGLLYQKRKEKVVPGEMERIELKKDLLAAHMGQTIAISVEKREMPCKSNDSPA